LFKKCQGKRKPVIRQQQQNDDDDKGLWGWGEELICTLPRSIDANIQPVYAKDSLCMMKSHILQEVAPFTILTEHRRSRRVSLEKSPPVQAVHYHAKGTSKLIQQIL
jgi:hypothetical protein